MDHLKAALTELQGKHHQARTAASSKGCDPDCDVCCLTLCAALKALESAQDSIAAHAACMQADQAKAGK